MEEETGSCLLVDYFERLLGRLWEIRWDFLPGEGFCGDLLGFRFLNLKYFNDN